MIFYFSGTGNSRYVAECISKSTDDKLMSINTLIKSKSDESFESASPYVFVTPVFAGRIPKIVDLYIRQTNFEGAKDVYFIVTCANTPWATASYVEKLCAFKGFNLLGFRSIVMPQGYIAHSDIKTEAENDEIIEAANSMIFTYIECISNNRPFPQEKLGKSMMSNILNPIMYAMMISSKKFLTTDSCDGCGQCSKLCPLNNIEIENGKPHWGNTCTHCMACIASCPQKAIEYGKVTVGRNRYYNTKIPQL